MKAGFAASGMVASVLKASAPLGILRLLVGSGAMPLHAEQRRYRALVSSQDYRAWIDAVVYSFSHSAGAELRSVMPAARYAHDQQATTEQPQFGDLPLAVLASPAYGAKWITMQSELLKRSRQSIQRTTDDRSHNIHTRHPDLVVNTIREMLDRR